MKNLRIALIFSLLATTSLMINIIAKENIDGTETPKRLKYGKVREKINRKDYCRHCKKKQECTRCQKQNRN
jgi:hypothetical protein